MKHIILLTFPWILILFVCALLAHYGFIDRTAFDKYDALIGLLVVILLFLKLSISLIYCFYQQFIKGTPDQFKTLLISIRRTINNPKQWLNSVFMIFTFSFVLSVFTSFKAIISEIIPFYMDDKLIQLDRFIHFGVEPWQITHFFFSSPYASLIMNYIYFVWFVLVFAFTCGVILFSKNYLFKMQVFISTISCWIIIGNVFAVLFSSVGPCYYEYTGGEFDGFNALMESLYQQNDYLLSVSPFLSLYTLTMQETLWEAFASGKEILGSGVSSMPSMHVSMAFLVVFSCYKRNRVLGNILLIFAMIILLGSVHLGWHYAVDGYFAIVCTYVIWVLSGKLVLRLSNPILDVAYQSR